MSTVDEKLTAQFKQLIKERDELNNAATVAERERRREEHNLQELRSTLHDVSDQLRLAQSENGEGTRKLQNLEDGKARLSKLIESDRHDIIKITSEVKGKESEETVQKWNFVREMECINDELDTHLKNEENQKILRLINHDTLMWLIEEKLPAFLIRFNGNSEIYDAAEKEKWQAIESGIKVESKAFVEAREMADVVIKERAELEHLLQTLRDKFKQEYGNIWETKMDDLEAKWERKWDYDNPAIDGKNNPELEDEIGSFNEKDQAKKSMETFPIHMELFYDSKEYMDSSNDLLV